MRKPESSTVTTARADKVATAGDNAKVSAEERLGVKRLARSLRSRGVEVESRRERGQPLILKPPIRATALEADTGQSGSGP